jgi:type 1 glutamine amidotransferase
MTARRYLTGLAALALSALALSALALSALSFAAPAAGKAKVLIYSGSTGYRHDSIPAGVEAVKAIATRLGLAYDTSEDPEVFSASQLADYQAIVFVSTTTDPKKPESEWFQGARRDALVGFLKAGKGVVGLHAAADSHYHWPWFGQLMGGYFERHPKGTPKGTQTVVDASHPATARLPKTITRNDEWYYYKDFSPLVRVLITVDPATIGDGEADANPNPLVWYQEFGGGRVFYNGLGHTSESYAEPYMVDLITGGLQYAVGR